MKSLALLIAICVLLISCNSPELPSLAESSDQIRINQVGYYPQSIKEFVVADLEATTLQVISEHGIVVHKGQLEDKGSWEASGEQISE